jgi:hypothetical protein
MGGNPRPGILDMIPGLTYWKPSESSSNVTSDTFAVSGRSTLDALVAGERDPVVPAGLASAAARKGTPLAWRRWPAPRAAGRTTRPAARPPDAFLDPTRVGQYLISQLGGYVLDQYLQAHQLPRGHAAAGREMICSHEPPVVKLWSRSISTSTGASSSTRCPGRLLAATLTFLALALGRSWCSVSTARRSYWTTYKGAPLWRTDRGRLMTDSGMKARVKGYSEVIRP